MIGSMSVLSHFGDSTELVSHLEEEFSMMLTFAVINLVNESSRRTPSPHTELIPMGLGGKRS
jgi:hypothetical protein